MLNVLSVGYILIIIILAHFFTPIEYNWKENTISELASQHYKKKWIMQGGFIGFGVVLSAGIVTNNFSYLQLPFLIYAAAVLISGIFCTKPFMNHEYSIKESKIHSFCAQLAGIMFSLGLFIRFISANEMSLKILHFSFFIFVVLTSITFGLLKKNKGIAQRILYIGSFLWIALFL